MSKLPIKQVPQLSHDFAEQLLNLESELVMQCTAEKVQELLRLYTQAVEYYEAKEDPKHLHYQTRMHALLSKPEVLQLFKCPPSRQQSTRACTVPVAQPDELSADQKLTNHSMRCSSTMTLAKANIYSQQRSLAERLVQRTMRKKKQKTAAPQRRDELDHYESEVERVFEWFCARKREIRRKLELAYADESKQALEAVIATELTALESEKRAKIEELRTELSK